MCETLNELWSRTTTHVTKMAVTIVLPKKGLTTLTITTMKPGLPTLTHLACDTRFHSQSHAQKQDEPAIVFGWLFTMLS